MIDVSENIPFLWRLSSHNGDGFCMVSMVVPFNSGDESLEHTIETDVLSFSSDDSISEEEEVLEWNEEDISLFLKLLANHANAQGSGSSESIKVDLTDPETIEIIQIVAAAGFGLPQVADDFLVESSNTQIDFECEIGSLVSLNTIKGYKRCVVVDMDDDDVVCVLLEKIDLSQSDQFEDIGLHELLLVKRHQVLHPLYTSDTPTRLDVLH